MNPQDGQVTDLIRGLEEGAITADQSVSSLEERGLTEKAGLGNAYWAYLIWIMPCFLPTLWTGGWNSSAFWAAYLALSFLPRPPMPLWLFSWPLFP